MYDPRVRRRSYLLMILIVVLAFSLGVHAERHGLFAPGYEPSEARQTFRPFWECWNLVHDKYVDRDSINDERMTHGAILGMLNSLGDFGHTTYLDKEAVQRLQEDLKGELYGIGVSLGMRNQRPTIIYTIPHSPARTAGLKPDDVIQQVDGKDVQSLPQQQIGQRIRGEVGTEVHLKVLRGNPPRSLDFSIERARVEVPDVAWKMLPGEPRIAHIALRSFGERTDEHLRTALEESRQQGAKAVILDVRRNLGGLKEQAVKVSSEFLKPGTVVFIQRNAKGQTQEILAEEGGIAHDIPLCLLIDEVSASSSEILAGAVQDHARGKLVGTRTFGTGTVLGQFSLSDGSALLLAISEWLTPKGRQIWHKGITPDFEAPLPRDVSIVMPESETELTVKELSQNKDTQLLKAIEVITAKDKKDAKDAEDRK